MTAALSPQPILQFLTASGTPLVGGKLHTYITGTDTPLVTYTSATMGATNTNPVVLDSRGEANVWLGTSNAYRFVLTTSTDVPVWGPIDNITNVESALQAYKDLLISSTGSSYIGFIQAGDDAVYRTVQSKLRDELNFLDFGAVSGGSTATNNAAMDAALIYMKESGKAMRVPAGDYELSGDFETDGDFLIYGDGNSSTLSGDYTITVSGTLTAIENVLTANEGNATVTFDDAPSLVAGDVFVLYDPTDYSWNASRAVYRAGEWCKCRGISGDDAYLVNPLYDGYNPATITAYKLESPNVRITNLKLSGINNFGIVTISLCNTPVIENVTGYNENNYVIAFDRCYNPFSINCNIYNKGDGGDDYGLVIGNCQPYRVVGGDFYARRHGIAIGGADAIGGVPNRNGRVIGATIQNDITSGVYAADMHGNMEDHLYIDCDIYNGGGLAGKDTGYENCRIGSDLYGVCVRADEVKGGKLSVVDCNLLCGTDPDATNRGVIDFGGGGAILSTWTTDLVNIVMDGCFVRSSALSSSSPLMKVVVDSCPVNVNIKINDIAAEINALSSILRTEVRAGTGLCEAIIVDNISNFPSGTILHDPASSDFGNAPQRMMRQSGQTTVEAATGTNHTIPASAITYQYAYPRTPVGQATVGGSTAFYLNGNLSVQGSIYRVRSTDIWPYIESSSAANWNQTNNVTVNWTAAIEEI